MNLQTMLIFALLGALLLFVVTGGMSAMMDSEADSATLGGGAALGAALGAGVGWLQSEEGSAAAESVLPAAVTSLMKGGGDDTEMKVGLPAF